MTEPIPPLPGLSPVKGKAVGKALRSNANALESNASIPLRELLNEVMGITDENRAIMRLVNEARYAVSAVRQDHRETLAELLQEQFSRKVSKEEWTRLHKGMGQIDIAALERFSAEEIRAFMTNERARAQEIARLEETIKSLGAGTASAKYLRKAEQLAAFMVTVQPEQGQLLVSQLALAADFS